MTKSIIRILILLALSGIAVVGIFSSPLDDSSSWLYDLISGKILGMAAGFSFVRLYRRWKSCDAWIARYERWCASDPEK